MSIYSDILDAIETKNMQKLGLIFSSNDKLLNKRIPGGTWLHYAAQHGQPIILEYLISKGLDVNAAEKHYGTTPLIEACSNGQYENAKYLIEQGSILDTSETVRNPLFAVSSGASTTLQNERKQDPTVDINADDPRFLKIAKLLLEAGIDATVRYNDCWKDMDALAFAVMWGQIGIAKIIAKWIAEGDEKLTAALLKDAKRVAQQNTEPVE